VIHINVEGIAPDAAWLARAEILRKQLLRRGLKQGDRHKLIEANQKLWRELEPWLRQLSHGKCWYSEARDCATYWHVDHFRPKNEVKDLNGMAYEGYWWLAFDWRNYRLAGNALNVPKSTKFPVRDDKWACKPTDDLDDEFPYLLDPVCPEDPSLLSFDDQGKAMPAERHDEWHHERAKVSIDILNLNYDSLKRGRKRVWDECMRHARDVLHCKDTIQKNSSVSKKQRLRDGVLSLKRMVTPDAEFSAVAAVCVRAQGSRWLERTVLGN
jgi:uncharacterized protein (TIGR02646 family)